MTFTIKSRIAAFLAVVAIGSLSAVQAAPHSKIGHSKTMAAHTVYVCNDCHAFYSPAMAKKMGYKDSIGHMLVKQSKAPTGFTDGSKMKM